jgi:DNA polymerase
VTVTTARASLVFVGEQPGEQADRTAHPFVGRLLDAGLETAGIDRRSV